MLPGLASCHKKNEAQPDFTDFTEDSREKVWLSKCWPDVFNIKSIFQANVSVGFSKWNKELTDTVPMTEKLIEVIVKKK